LSCFLPDIATRLLRSMASAFAIRARRPRQDHIVDIAALGRGEG